jgi:hypothetical protein
VEGHAMNDTATVPRRPVDRPLAQPSVIDQELADRSGRRPRRRGRPAGGRTRTPAVRGAPRRGRPVRHRPEPPQPPTPRPARLDPRPVNPATALLRRTASTPASWPRDWSPQHGRPNTRTANRACRAGAEWGRWGMPGGFPCRDQRRGRAAESQPVDLAVPASGEIHRRARQRTPTSGPPPGSPRGAAPSLVRSAAVASS